MSDTASAALDEYLRALVEGRYEDMWRWMSTADRVAKPLPAFLATVRNAGGRVAPQRIESVREDDSRAEATVIALCSLPIDPVAELERLEASGAGDSAGAEQLRRIVARWDGSYEHRPRSVHLIKEPDGWRVVEGWTLRP